MTRFAVIRCQKKGAHAPSVGVALVVGTRIRDASRVGCMTGARFGVALWWVAIYFVLWGKEVE